MGFFSITFLLLSFQLTSFFGPVGFILANCTNMLLRIIFSIIYIRKQYNTVNLKPLDGIIPKKLFTITLIVLGIVCKVSEVIWSIYALTYECHFEIEYHFKWICFSNGIHSGRLFLFFFVVDTESFVSIFNIGTYYNRWNLFRLCPWSLGLWKSTNGSELYSETSSKSVSCM